MDAAPEDPRRVVRRRADAIAVGAALGVLVLSTAALGRVDRIPAAEVSLFRAINELPGLISLLVVPPMYLGVVWAALAVAALLLIARRPWASVAVAVAGVAAYAAARLGKHLIGRTRPGELLAAVQTRDNFGGLGYPSGHAAVAAAIVVAILPYLAWRRRWYLLLIPVVVAFARVYVGAHLPLDVVGGAAIGVAVASLVHLTLGVPPSAVRERDAVSPSQTARGSPVP